MEIVVSIKEIFEKNTNAILNNPLRNKLNFDQLSNEFDISDKKILSFFCKFVNFFLLKISSFLLLFFIKGMLNFFNKNMLKWIRFLIFLGFSKFKFVGVNFSKVAGKLGITSSIFWLLPTLLNNRLHKC